MPSSSNLPKDLSDALGQLHSFIIINDAAGLDNFLRTTNVKILAHIVNEIDDDGYAAIHRAVRREEQLPVLAALLRGTSAVGAAGVAAIDLDVLGADRETAVFMAVHSNNIKAVSLLLEAGSKALNTMCGPTEGRKEAPLHAAVKFGYEDMVTFLLARRAEINCRETALKQTPLMVAAKNNRPAIVYILLMAGALPTPVDGDGKDALYLASENRHVHCVTLLKSEKKYLNDVMSQVRSDMKMEKPSLHSSEQLLQMLKARKEKEEAEEKAAMELLAKKKPAEPLVMSPLTAIAAAENDKENESKKKKQMTTAATALAAAAEQQQQQQPEQIQKAELASTLHHVPPMATRTHDPLTGKKLPPCKTLEEVGPTLPIPVPPEIANRKPTREETERIGATRMVVGAGLPDDVREPVDAKRNKPMMFVNGDADGLAGSVPYA